MAPAQYLGQKLQPRLALKYKRPFLSWMFRQKKRLHLNKQPRKRVNTQAQHCTLIQEKKKKKARQSYRRIHCSVNVVVQNKNNQRRVSEATHFAKTKCYRNRTKVYTVSKRTFLGLCFFFFFHWPAVERCSKNKNREQNKQQVRHSNSDKVHRPPS